MANDMFFPADRRYFTIADLVALGLSYSKINQLVRDGHLIELGDSRYENAHFEERKQQENARTEGQAGDAPLQRFLPALLMSDLRGMRRSVVHYVIPSCPDALQLVQIGVETTEPNYSFGPATRDHDIFHFVLAGKGDVTVGRQRFTVQAGQIFYLPKDVLRYYESDDQAPLEYVWIGFCGEWARRLISEAGMNRSNMLADIPDIAATLELRRELVQTMRTDVSYIAMMPVFWKFIQQLIRAKGYAVDVKTSAKNAEDKCPDPRIAELVYRLERNYTNDINVNEIAKDISVSRAWLSRRFKEITGATVKQYVTDLRISHAKDLLTQTPLPIMEVARACGYQNPLFFSRMFKQATGFSPTQWRERYNTI